MQPINKRKKPFYVERGDIYLTDFGNEADVVGSEQFGVRPAVVTSSNFLNRRSPTVIVAAITSELKKVSMDSHYLLPTLSALPRSSMVLGEQRFTIDKQRLIKYCCKLPPEVMEDVTRACRKAEEADKKRRKFKARRD